MKVNKRILTMIIGTLMIGSMVVGCEKKEEQVTPTVQVEEKTEEQKEINEVVYDDNNIKVIYKGVEYEEILSTTNYKFRIESGNDREIQVQTENTSINDSMVDEYIATSIAPGKNLNTELMVEASTLQDNGIDKVEKIETTLVLMDYETYKVIDKRKITLDFTK